jgi:hypothetical protein
VQKKVPGMEIPNEIIECLQDVEKGKQVEEGIKI